jgi:hypothetical protein
LGKKGKQPWLELGRFKKNSSNLAGDVNEALLWLFIACSSGVLNLFLVIHYINLVFLLIYEMLFFFA